MHPSGARQVRAESAATVLDSIRLLLQKLAETQQAFLELLHEKSEELRSPRAAHMRELVRREQLFVQQLSGLEQRRADILAEAVQRGFSSGTLRGLLQRLSAEGQKTNDLLTLVKSCEGVAVQIRQLSWTQWIVAQRASAYFKSILELIANHGQKSPDYSHGAQRPTVGGAILDASA